MPVTITNAGKSSASVTPSAPFNLPPDGQIAGESGVVNFNQSIDLNVTVTSSSSPVGFDTQIGFNAVGNCNLPAGVRVIGVTGP